MIRLALILLLSGCAAMDYDWKFTSAPIHPKQWRYVYLADARKVCQNYYPRAADACTVRGHECLMILPINPPRWLVEHERKHCEGWNHG